VKHCPVVSQESLPERRLVGHRGRSRATTGLNCVECQTWRHHQGRQCAARRIEELLPSWSMAPVVMALQAMRGIALVVAVTVVAEVGDFRRFAKARQLMAISTWCRPNIRPALDALGWPCHGNGVSASGG
jgi:hypothetical protein